MKYQVLPRRLALSLLWSMFTLAITPVLAQVRDKQMSVQDDNAGSELSPAQLGDFKQEVTRKMKELESYISIIGDKDKPDDIRDNAIELAIKLFEQGSRMQVTSLRTGKLHTYPLLQYFNQLKDAAGYTQVKITFYDVVKVDDWKMAGDGKGVKYTTTGTYFQQFEGIRNGKMVYSDRTKKSVEVSLSDREDAFYKEKGWVVLLGNVKAEDTYQIPKP